MPPEGWGYAEGSDFSGTCSDWLRSPGEPVLPRSPDWQEAPARQPPALNADAESVLLLSPGFDRVHSDGSGASPARLPAFDRVHSDGSGASNGSFSRTSSALRWYSRARPERWHVLQPFLARQRATFLARPLYRGHTNMQQCPMVTERVPRNQESFSHLYTT